MKRTRQLALLGSVPEGDTATKRNGEKLYAVRSTLRIYGGPEGGCDKIVAPQGWRFMIPTTGDVNLIPSDTYVLWDCGDNPLPLYPGEECHDTST